MLWQIMLDVSLSGTFRTWFGEKFTQHFINKEWLNICKFSINWYRMT